MTLMTLDEATPVGDWTGWFGFHYVDLAKYHPPGPIIREPEVFVDPTYTPAQILREKSVLLRVNQATHQRGAAVFDFTAFNDLWP